MNTLKEKAETTAKSTQRILVVDDENSISELIATSLRFVGFDVRTAANGSQALTIAEEFKPHDEVIMKQIPGNDYTQAEAARQAIRDKYAVMQNAINAATNVEEIKAVLP